MKSIVITGFRWSCFGLSGLALIFSGAGGCVAPEKSARADSAWVEQRISEARRARETQARLDRLLQIAQAGNHAVELDRQACAAGSAHACYNLGLEYQYGLGGLVVDPAQAMAFYRLAASRWSPGPAPPPAPDRISERTGRRPSQVTGPKRIGCPVCAPAMKSGASVKSAEWWTDVPGDDLESGHSVCIVLPPEDKAKIWSLKVVDEEEGIAIYRLTGPR